MDGLYKIGAVSRITGINIPTLRSWESKYSIVSPTRINGTQRGYTKQDLDKLGLIQALIDVGDSISSLQGLSIDQLEARLSNNSNNASNSLSISLELSAISIGTMIPNLESKSAGLPSIKIVQEYDLSHFIENENEAVESNCDLLIIELPTLHLHTVNWIRNIQIKNKIDHCIILYRYASPGGIQASSFDKKIYTLRQPVTAQDIQLVVKFLTDVEPSSSNHSNSESSIEHKSYTDKELWEISIMANPIHCECPKHLSSIITSLRGFEKYSSDCEDLSESDRLLHKELEENAKNARIIMEKSLRKVIEENAVNFSTANAS